MPTEKQNKKYDFVFWIIAIGFMLILWTALQLFWGCRFETNDDTGMMRTIAGYGHPQFVTQYGNIFIAYILTLFYHVFPHFSWYTAYNILAVVIGIAVVLKCIYRVIHKWQMLLVFGILLTLIVLFFIGLKALLFMTFTVNACIIGGASIIELLDSDYMGKINKSSVVCSFLLLIWCAMIRYASYKAILPFYIIVLLFVLLKQIGSIKNVHAWRNMRKYFPIILGFCCVILCLSIYNKWEQNYKDKALSNAEDSYSEFEHYRGLFSDRPQVTYDEYPEFYESIGWDKEFYNMARRWFYLDRRFNIDTLKAITEYSSDKIEIVEVVNNLWINVKSGLVEFKVFIISTIIMFVLCFGNIMVRGQRSYIFICLICCGVCTAEFLYLCHRGRLISRSFYCVAFPTLCVLIYSCSKYLSKASNKLVEGVICCLLIALTIWTGRNCILKNFNKEANQVRIRSDMIAADAEQYYADHPDEFFVYDSKLVGDTRLCSGTGPYSNNKIFWGGTGAYTKVFYDRLKDNGFDEFYVEDFLRDNVHLITTDSNMNESEFAQYIRSLYPEAYLEIVDQTPSGIYIYSVREQ